MFFKFSIRFLAMIALGFALSGNILSPQAAPLGNILRVKSGATGANNGSSWANAYPNLQAALTAAVNGDEIWVAAGIYKPTLTTTAGDARTATFQLKNGVELYGGFAGNETSRNQRNWKAHLTVLSGDLDNNDTTSGGVVTDPNNITGNNAYHVLSSGSITTMMDGFTVTAGKANAANPHSRGGGLYNNGGSLRMNNMIFRGNIANHGGGVLSETGSNLTLTNTVLANNLATIAGGGALDDSGTLTVINTVFSNNAANTEGGGLYVRYDAANLANCVFNGNTAGTTGGGMWNEEAHPTLVNCTFSGNNATNEAGAIYNWNRGTVAIYNSILWGNTSASSPQINNNGFDLNYCLVQGGWTGTGNISSDPQFISPQNGNLSLRPTSPAIDAGDKTLVPTDGLDLDGDSNTSEPLPLDFLGKTRFADLVSRPNTGVGTPPVDMGAYEIQNLLYIALATW